jgi:hypothetical protein
MRIPSAGASTALPQRPLLTTRTTDRPTPSLAELKAGVLTPRPLRDLKPPTMAERAPMALADGSKTGLAFLQPKAGPELLTTRTTDRTTPNLTELKAGVLKPAHQPSVFAPARGALASTASDRSASSLGVADFINRADGRPSVILHGGNRAAKPDGYDNGVWDNSFASLNSAMDLAREEDFVVEFDVHLNTHPDSITPETPYGMLYLKHNPFEREVDAEGRRFGPTISMRTSSPGEVGRIAMSLPEFFAAFPRSEYPNVGLVMEAKVGGRNANDATVAAEIKRVLAEHGRDDGSIVVSSLSRQLLDEVGDQNDSGDGANIPRMMVFGWDYHPTAEDVRSVAEAGIENLAVNLGRDREQVFEAAQQYNLGIVSWHWNFTDAQAANEDALSLPYSGLITDDGPHAGDLIDEAATK